MTDDLVERLREGACLHNQLEAYDLTTEAADRIEELQKQLAASDEEIRALRDEIENLEYEMCEMENAHD
jgi:predicted  nucleic acid-binding Zn-ribbon protein